VHGDELEGVRQDLMTYLSTIW